jgi:hypothetical protein
MLQPRRPTSTTVNIVEINIFLADFTLFIRSVQADPLKYAKLPIEDKFPARLINTGLTNLLAEFVDRVTEARLNYRHNVQQLLYKIIVRIAYKAFSYFDILLTVNLIFSVAGIRIVSQVTCLIMAPIISVLLRACSVQI